MEERAGLFIFVFPMMLGAISEAVKKRGAWKIDKDALGRK
jgi:hypothetical protein